VFAGAPTVAAAHPGSLDVASSRTHVRSDTPMPSSNVGQRMRVDVPRPLDLTLPTEIVPDRLNFSVVFSYTLFSCG